MLSLGVPPELRVQSPDPAAVQEHRPVSKPQKSLLSHVPWLKGFRNVARASSLSDALPPYACIDSRGETLPLAKDKPTRPPDPPDPKYIMPAPPPPLALMVPLPSTPLPAVIHTEPPDPPPPSPDPSAPLQEMEDRLSIVSVPDRTTRTCPPPPSPPPPGLPGSSGAATEP